MTDSPSSAVKVKSGAGSPGSGKASSKRRAVGIVRVSRKGDREGERFTSPGDQRERIRVACDNEGLTLLDTLEEVNVSGGAALAKRPRLLRAIELIEAGQADAIVVAYFDRLFRNLEVQAQTLRRVEDAGGKVITADSGTISTETASEWLDAGFKGLVAEHQRRVTKERTAFAKRGAVERGVPPFPNIPPGYRQRPDGTLEPDKHADAVVEAFQMRANGATVKSVREHLRRNGIERTFHGTQALLRSRMYLGELRFGELVNENSHQPIVDAALWERVQRTQVSRGRRPKSDMLLARLGVLRCGTCGSRMIVGHGSNRDGTQHAFYRCPPVGDCPQRTAINAQAAETAVVDAVQELLRGEQGTAAVADGIEDAERALQDIEDELDAAVRAFDGLQDVESVRDKLLALREQREQARERVDELRGVAQPAITVTADDWHLLTLDERRALIQAVIETATVAPGRGSDRVTIKPRL